MAQPVQKGKIAVRCNKCGGTAEVATTDYYRKGGFVHECGGKFSTVKQKRPRTHKPSRDRKPRASGKG